MLHYDYFAAITALVKSVDPKLEHQDFSVSEVDFNDDWRHILHDCARIKADVFVNEQSMIVNVEFNDRDARFCISYRPVSDRRKKALEFLRIYKRFDPLLAEGMYNVFMEHLNAKFYEEIKMGRVHYGVKVDNKKIYEGTVKLDSDSINL